MYCITHECASQTSCGPKIPRPKAKCLKDNSSFVVSLAFASLEAECNRDETGAGTGVPVRSRKIMSNVTLC